MRVRVTLEYDIDKPVTYQGFKEELMMMTSGEEGLPGTCVYAAIEEVIVPQIIRLKNQIDNCSSKV